MLVIGFLQWWYGPGWRWAGNNLVSRLNGTASGFSIPILLRTLFEPWRRIITPSDGALSQRVRAMFDNLISRFVGFGVRILTLITGGIIMAGTLVIGGIIVILWPLLPPIGVLLALGGFLI